MGGAKIHHFITRFPMMTISRRSLLLGALMSAVMLSACGKKEEAAAPAAAPAPAAAAPAADKLKVGDEFHRAAESFD